MTKSAFDREKDDLRTIYHADNVKHRAQESTDAGAPSFTAYLEESGVYVEEWKNLSSMGGTGSECVVTTDPKGRQTSTMSGIRFTGGSGRVFGMDHQGRPVIGDSLRPRPLSTAQVSGGTEIANQGSPSHHLDQPTQAGPHGRASSEILQIDNTVQGSTVQPTGKLCYTQEEWDAMGGGGFSMTIGPDGVTLSPSSS
jgi:hypothetical protein